MIDKLMGPVSGILDKVIADKDQAAKLAEIATAGDKHAQELAMAQLENSKLMLRVTGFNHLGGRLSAGSAVYHSA